MHSPEQGNQDQTNVLYSIKTVDGYCSENQTTPINSKRYFRGTTLEEIISNYPVPKIMQTKERKRGKITLFMDFGIYFVRKILSKNVYELFIWFT
jgi:hypothetical protein